MNINNLWYICLLVRLSFVYLIKYLYKTKSADNKLVNIITFVLFAISSGFLYKGYTGSNNETQISKVFWHSTRYVHGVLYLLSSVYLYNKNIEMTSLLLYTDIMFSILYRLVSNQ